MDYVNVLVLNNSFEPLHFCNVRRAIVMILMGKAEEIETNGRVIRTPSLTFKLPTVIRLMKYIIIPYKRGVIFSKKNVFKRDNYTCQYCGSGTRDNNRLTIDHIIPKSRDGKTAWKNVVTACRTCNIKKGNRTLRESKMRLARQPFKPKYLVNAGITMPLSKAVFSNYSKYLYVEA